MKKLSDVTKNLTNERSAIIAKRLGRLSVINPNYKNLDEDNKKVILDLIEKYKKILKRGVKTSSLMIKRDRSYLYSNRIKLGLSQTDLKQIFDLLESFKD